MYISLWYFIRELATGALWLIIYIVLIIPAFIVFISEWSKLFTNTSNWGRHLTSPPNKVINLFYSLDNFFLWSKYRVRNSVKSNFFYELKLS